MSNKDFSRKIVGIQDANIANVKETPKEIEIDVKNSTVLVAIIPYQKNTITEFNELLIFLNRKYKKAVSKHFSFATAFAV